MKTEYSIVIECVHGKKQAPIVLDGDELAYKIQELCKKNSDKYTIITEKDQWYKVVFDGKKNYLLYKKST